MNRKQIKDNLKLALKDDIGVTIPDSGKGHGTMKLNDSTILLGTEIASNGARYVFIVELDDFIDVLELETKLSGKSSLSHADLHAASKKMVDGEEIDSGYEKHLDRWKAEGKLV